MSVVFSELGVCVLICEVSLWLPDSSGVFSNLPSARQRAGAGLPGNTAHLMKQIWEVEYF